MATWPKNELIRSKCSFINFNLFFSRFPVASVHQQSPIIDRVTAGTPPTLSNLSSDSAYDKYRLLNGHHVSVFSSLI